MEAIQSLFSWIVGGLGVVAFLAWWNQESLLYVPSLPQAPKEHMLSPSFFGWDLESDPSLEFEEVYLGEGDEVKLQTWYFYHTDHDPGRKLLLFFHSNAGNLSHRLPHVRLLLEKANVDVCILSYRGYGKSGSVPSEIGIKEDSKRVFQWLKERNASSSPIVLYGRSLGCAVALNLARELPNETRIKGIIVENPFTNIDDMIDVILTPIFWPIKHLKFLSRNKWENLEAVRELDPAMKLLIITGMKDNIVPPSMSKRLKDAAKCNQQHLVFPEASHMDCHEIGGEEYWTGVNDFIKSL